MTDQCGDLSKVVFSMLLDSLSSSSDEKVLHFQIELTWVTPELGSLIPSTNVEMVRYEVSWVWWSKFVSCETFSLVGLIRLELSNTMACIILIYSTRESSLPLESYWISNDVSLYRQALNLESSCHSQLGSQRNDHGTSTWPIDRGFSLFDEISRALASCLVSYTLPWNLDIILGSWYVYEGVSFPFSWYIYIYQLGPDLSLAWV